MNERLRISNDEWLRLEALDEFLDQMAEDADALDQPALGMKCRIAAGAVRDVHTRFERLPDGDREARG